MKLLPKGDHTNTSIRKGFGLKDREVHFVDQDGKKSSYTPNRRQRKAIGEFNRSTIKRRLFEASEAGQKKLKERAEKKSKNAKVKADATQEKRDKVLERLALAAKPEPKRFGGFAKLFGSKSKQKSNY